MSVRRCFWVLVVASLFGLAYSLLAGILGQMFDNFFIRGYIIDRSRPSLIVIGIVGALFFQVIPAVFLGCCLNSYIVRGNAWIYARLSVIFIVGAKLIDIFGTFFNFFQWSFTFHPKIWTVYWPFRLGEVVAWILVASLFIIVRPFRSRLASITPSQFE